MVNTGSDTENRTCPVCKIAVEGRKDKRYCSEKCRTADNSTKRKERDYAVTLTLQVLRHNRSILKRLSPRGKTILRKEVLDELGFDPTVFSSIFINQKNQIYYLCCDYGFLPIHENGTLKALIIRRQQFIAVLDPWRKVKDED